MVMDFQKYNTTWLNASAMVIGVGRYGAVMGRRDLARVFSTVSLINGRLGGVFRLCFTGVIGHGGDFKESGITASRASARWRILNIYL